jgi:hypothetical protein
MKLLAIISLIFMALGIFNCSSRKNSPEKKYIWTITTYLKTDSLPEFKYSTEKKDSLGNPLELIYFSRDMGLVSYIENYGYDSLHRMTLITQTWLRIKQLPEVNTELTFYNQEGRVSKSITTLGPDTITVTNEYDSNGKIKLSITTSTKIRFKYYWEGLTKFYYDTKDSCIKKENYDLSGTNLQNRDSILYTDTSQIVLKFNLANKASGKTEYIFRAGRKVRQIDYNINTMSNSDEFYVDRHINFEYKNDDLIKKTIETMQHTEWCGVQSPGKTEIFTYSYE